MNMKRKHDQLFLESIENSDLKCRRLELAQKYAKYIPCELTQIEKTEIVDALIYCPDYSKHRKIIRFAILLNFNMVNYSHLN